MITINGYVLPKFYAYTITQYDLIDSSNSFRTQDGVQHDCIVGTKYKIAIRSENVTGAKLTELISAITATSTFNVVFTMPNGTTLTKKCKCAERPYTLDRYNAPQSTFWSFNVTLEEV